MGNLGGVMAARVEQRSLESEIADCCHAIYWTTEPEVAMKNWARLRELTAEKAEVERGQYIREARNTR